jgi:hypothetical protein
MVRFFTLLALLLTTQAFGQEAPTFDFAKGTAGGECRRRALESHASRQLELLTPAGEQSGTSPLARCLPLALSALGH